MNRVLAAVVGCAGVMASWAAAPAVPGPPAEPVRPIDSADAGRVLMGDLNCAACHSASEAQAQWLSPKSAPRLTDVGSRASPDWIGRYLAAPHEAMPGVKMPDLLGGLPAAERAATAEALTHYLLSAPPPAARRVLPDRAAVLRGEALYHKVGCVACHAPQNAPRDAAAAPAGSVPIPRMDEKWAFEGLRRFLRDPLASRPSGRMPSMGLTDAEAADVAHYLLRDTRVPATLEVAQYRGRVRSLEDLDSAEVGRTGPADGFTLDAMGRGRGYALRFSGWLRVDRPGDYAFRLTAAGASRLSIDDKWLLGQDSWRRERVEGKAGLRLEPGTHAIVVDYVQRGPDDPSLKVEWEGPGVPREVVPAARLRSGREPVPEPPPFAVDAAKAAKGRDLYAALNCAVCHENKPHQRPPPPLTALEPTRGCLADRPTAGAPDFHLDAASVRSIRDALAELRRGDLPPPSPRQRLAHTMASLRCTACHARDGVGGVTAARDAYFTSNGEDLGDEGRLPPRLDGVGDKLRPDAIADLLKGAAAVRPYLNTRMPQFGEANTAHLPDLFVALDRRPDPAKPDPAKPDPAKPSPDAPDVQRDAGRRLVGTDGLSCIVCHRFNRQPGQTMQVVDLAAVAGRLNEDWFRQFLIDPNRFHPGTRMPSFWPDGKSLLPGLLGGDTGRQQAALWTYLADGGRAKFPEGLSRRNAELVVGGEAVVYRGKLWEAGFRAVAVGYPGQVNMAFDAEDMRLSLLWRGRFLDAGPHWTVQGMGQIRPLGTDVVVFPRGSPLAVLADAAAPWPDKPAKALGLKFGGYQLDALKRPTLLYSFGEAGVEDSVTPVEGGAKAGLRRTITFAGPPPDKLHLRLAAGKLGEAGENAWRLNDTMTITVRGGGKPLVRGSGDQQELLVPVRFGDNDKGRRLEVDYAW